MNVGDKVVIIGENTESFAPSMLGKKGIIKSFGTSYVVKGKSTREVYVEIGLPYEETHVFNDYHLKIIK